MVLICNSSCWRFIAQVHCLVQSGSLCLSIKHECSSFCECLLHAEMGWSSLVGGLPTCDTWTKCNLAACAALMQATLCSELSGWTSRASRLLSMAKWRQPCARCKPWQCCARDIQAANATWFCQLVQLPQPRKMVVTLHGLYNSNLASKAAVLLGTPQARINNLQLSGAALHQALPSLHMLPRLLTLSLEGPAQFPQLHVQWPPFPQLQRLELSRPGDMRPHNVSSGLTNGQPCSTCRSMSQQAQSTPC